MTRSGYNDDIDNIDNWDLIRWRGAVLSATRGNRGQAFLRELLSALDRLPEKRLIQNEFESGGEVCALGAVMRERGITSAENWLFDDGESAAASLNIARALACDVMWVNDEGGWRTETPEMRYERVRKWVASLIVEPKP